MTCQSKISWTGALTIIPAVLGQWYARLQERTLCFSTLYKACNAMETSETSCSSCVTGGNSLVFFPENTENSAFFRLSGKSRLFAALKRHKLYGAFLVECGAHTNTDTRKWRKPHRCCCYRVVQCQHKVFKYFTFCCVLFRVLRVQLVAAPHIQARAQLIPAFKLAKADRKTCSVMNFSHRAFCVASTALHAMYKTV